MTIVYADSRTGTLIADRCASITGGHFETEKVSVIKIQGILFAVAVAGQAGSFTDCLHVLNSILSGGDIALEKCGGAELCLIALRSEMAKVYKPVSMKTDKWVCFSLSRSGFDECLSPYATGQSEGGYQLLSKAKGDVVVAISLATTGSTQLNKCGYGYDILTFSEREHDVINHSSWQPERLKNAQSSNLGTYVGYYHVGDNDVVEFV